MMEYHKLIPCFRTIIFAFLYLALSAKQAHSYAIGAPVEACTTLTPVHGYAPQSSTSPFSITPQFRNYGPSTSMQVNLTATGNKSFKGFMIQARIVGTTTPVGIFSDTSSVGQRIDCSGSFANTLTHINNNPKTLVTVAWTAPSTADGAVIEFVGTFVEQADTYWTYVRSFTLTDACSPSPCQNGATCFRAGTEGYLCNCENGYTGTNCADQPPCADEVATCGTNYKQCYLNGGNGPNSFVCECLDGSYSFDEACPDTPTEPPTTLAPTTMTTEMDPCRTGPCQNDGVCMKIGPTTYECDCHTIYTGPQCQYTVGCASFPCQNNGVCTSTGIYGQEYDCSCSVLYSGTNCEIEVDPCASSPCMNGGFCNRRGDMAGYVCTCYNGYTGIRCETSPPPTTMPPPTTPSQSTTPLPQTTPPVDFTTLGAGECNPTCLNGGSCVEDLCVCVSGFTGPRCEQDGRPFFTNCPEGETVTYVLDQGSNLASLDFDPITATNFNGENLEVTFIVGPDLNTVSSLEFSEDYQEGQIVVAQAVDPQNGARNCSFIIRLQDNQTPEITCPDDINEISTSSSRQVTWPDAQVNDNADPSPVVTYLPSRGSIFDATGESVSVIARATDSSSNYKECIFTVTVHMREYDCEPFPTIENAEVSCDNDASGRECQVTCNDGFVKTIANSIRYTCIADNAASFWDPTPSDICARAQVGNGISKTTIISFSLTSLLCPAQTTSFKSSIATNITNTLDTYNLCSLGSASACEPESVNTECTTNTGRGKRSIVLSRRRRDTSALLVDINVSSAVGSGSDQDMIEGDIDQIVDGIVDVANNEAFVLTVNGEVISNVQSGTRAPTEFQWSCDTGMVSSSSGCVPCQPGTYYDETVNLCVFCSRGYYQDQTRQTSCQPCPGDQLTDATGSVLADCYDPSGFQLTQTQWILIYIGGGLAGAFIILLFITLIICCCRSNEETPKKGKDATDNLTYLNRAFEDDSFNNEMHYTNTLSRNGSTMPMNGQRNGHVTGGDNRLIEIPSDPAVLYAEVPVTSFNAKGYNDFHNGSLRNGHANGHVNSVSANIDMDTIPHPPSLGAPPPPPPPPPADTKPQRIPTEDDDDNDVLPPPPSNNHHFNSMHADSAPPGPPPPPPKVPAGPPTPPKVSGVPPPPAPPSTAGAAAPPPPPPPPLPSVNSNNNSYTSSPTGSTASRRSDGRARFLL